MDRRSFISQFTAGPRNELARTSILAAPLPEISDSIAADGRSAPSPAKPLDIAAGLEPYTEPLDEVSAAHLLRRTGFGAAPGRVANLVGVSAADAAAGLVSDAANLALPDPPSWANTPPPNRNPESPEFQAFITDNNQWLVDYRYEWFELMYSAGLRERLTLFWHNHFVTSTGAYFLAAFAYRYLTLIRTHVLGDFRDFVRAIGIDPAMLLYLNGTQNEVGAPNENYARELLELFTMGPQDSGGTANYTEADIQEIARALTGWKVDFFTLESSFNPIFFDSANKTFLGQTGPYGYDDVVDIIFQERSVQIAEFICRKLYREFVYDVPDEATVSELAQILLQNDFRIAAPLETLLSSAHFFDSAVFGARVKSPAELVTGLLTESAAPLPVGIFTNAALLSFFMEQVVLNPPNVAGWPGHHAWVNTTTLPIRWLGPDFLMTNGTGTDLVDLIPLAQSVHDPNDPHAAFRLPLALADHFMPVPVAELDIPPVEGEFSGDLVNYPIPNEFLNGPEYVLDLAKLFLAGLPWHDWYLYEAGANLRIYLYLRFLFQLPEFQLT